MTAFFVTNREHPQKSSMATGFGRELPIFLDGQHTASVIVASLPLVDWETTSRWHGAEVIYDHCVLPLRRCGLDVLAVFLPLG